ncbi:unnamed protein product [Gongylonema pulchrum]|uniref:Secreted protein n=1 Tax=Gongylonema pulchrum TaxID=637853 RepID=A0A183EBN1_9BILA|nr:unnamed protein product [Gongylonema pulchrum]
MLDEFLDELRSPAVFLYISMLLSWCVVSSTQLGDSVELEFKAYRLQQYDVVGSPRGSRSWKVMYEAVSLDGNALRRCLVVSWRDLLGRDLQRLFGQTLSAVLIVLPSSLSNLTPATRNKLATLETSLLHVNTDAAVYVALQQPELQSLLSEVTVFSKRYFLVFYRFLMSSYPTYIHRFRRAFRIILNLSRNFFEKSDTNKRDLEQVMHINRTKVMGTT